MKTLAAAFAVLAMLGMPLNAIASKTCDDDSIDTVSDDGTIVKLISGHVYEITGGGEVDSELWLAAEDVLVCYEVVPYQGRQLALYTIINTDQDNEKVDAHKLK